MMSPARIFARIQRDPFELARYYAAEAGVLLLLVAALSDRWRSEIHLETLHLLAPLLAVPLGWWVSSVLHAAAHASHGALLWNRLLGELAGAYVGYGFGSFVLIHGLHHGHADTPRDPVSPRGMSFLRFFSGPMRHATRKALEFLDALHGGSPHYRWARVLRAVGFYVNLGLRAALWYLLFGPELFLLLYVPSLVSNVAILAHINYVCHRDDGGPDEVVIVNLDHNLYYRLANAITSGGYYHRAHHLHPRLRDPRSAARPEDLSLDRPAAAAPAGPLAALAAYFDLHGIWGPR